MAKKKITVKMYSFGEYTKWDRQSKEIPKILNITAEIKARIGTEFGYVLHIRQAKGETFNFQINHPPFTDENGKIIPPFSGEQFISTNDFQFFLGDCIWEPLDDKIGKWEITTFHKGKIVAQKVFNLHQ